MTTTAATPVVNAFVMKAGDKFKCVVGDKKIGASIHQDYFKYHHGRGDIKGLNVHIDQFVYLDDLGHVGYVINADGAIGNIDAKVLFKEARKAADIITAR